MNMAKLGDRVRVQYSRVRSGENGSGKPAVLKVVEFTVGSPDVMPGLSIGVIGMAPGEQKRLTLQPAEAFGEFQPGLVKEIPRARISRGIALRVGKRLSALSTSSGRQRRVRVIEIGRWSIKVDGNHSLAGKIVELDVQLLSVDGSSEANRSLPQFDIGGES
ncbi:MAG TPA: FKBP-type peptidyl-prolyl cis-trans isomerase [Pirellulales bacterium]|jgi:peptidylprolyl isomerase|nr:FKBP-type peptidyl-prolyl cis-trans isomerase [Pirellulales bacterium]